MTTLTLDLPAEVFSALRRSPEEFGRELRLPLRWVVTCGWPGSPDSGRENAMLVTFLWPLCRPRVSVGCWLALLLLAGRLGAQTDWLQFDFDGRHTGVNPFETQITSANVGDLRVLFNVTLPDVADGAPAYLSGVPTASGKRDLLFLTTRDGRLLALDALSGATVWARQPANAPP